MHRAVRVGLVVVGLLPLADVVLTWVHGRLEPRQEVPPEERRETKSEEGEVATRIAPGTIELHVYWGPPVPIIVGGLVLAAIGIWPVRRRSRDASGSPLLDRDSRSASQEPQGPAFDAKRLLAFPCYGLAMLVIQLQQRSALSAECHRGPFVHPVSLWGFGEWSYVVLVIAATGGSIARPHFAWVLALPLLYAGWLCIGC